MNPRRNTKSPARAKSVTSKTVPVGTMMGGTSLTRAGKAAKEKAVLIDFAKELGGQSEASRTKRKALAKALLLTNRPPGRGPGPVGEPSKEAKDLMRGVRPKTMRLEPQNEAGLDMLKDALGAPVNKMVNVAVSEYIQRKTVALELSLTEALERVKAHRRADPAFAKDLQAFVASEANFGPKVDPLEGTVYRVEPPARYARPKAAEGEKSHSALEMVRAVIGRTLV